MDRMLPGTTLLSNVICVLIFGLQVPFVTFLKQLCDALTQRSHVNLALDLHSERKRFSGIRLAQLLAHGMRLSVVLGLALTMKENHNDN